MIDWDALVLTPVMGVFSQAVDYSIAGGATLALRYGVFDDAYVSVDALSDRGVTSTMPTLGVRLAEFPAGFNPENAQGDTFTVRATGRVYVVKTGRPDSHGHARFEANLAP